VRRAFLLSLVILSAAVPAAEAQRAITARLDGVSDGSVVSGSVQLVGHGSSPAGIRKLTLTIDGETVAEVTPNGVRQNAEVTFDWDTTVYVGSNQLSRNREYLVRVKAVSNTGAEEQAGATVVVDNPPAIPFGLIAAAEKDEVTLSWESNPEPDIVGYRVERFFGNEYVEAALVEEPAFSESREPGRYSYRVVAIRSSQVSSEGLASEPSASVTVSIKGAGRRSGSAASGGGRARGKAAGSKRGAGRGVLGSRGLPGGVALPGEAGLPPAPAAPGLDWGSFEKRLPYRLPKGGVPIKAGPASKELLDALRVIPPDGLRWVAAGLLLVVMAALFRFIAWRAGAKLAT
jgi:hypothetical protein